MKPKVALFIYDPKCSVQSGNGVIRALGEHYDFRLFSKNEMEKGFFDNIDLVIFPGGFGDSDSYNRLLKENKESIINYVNRGGHYLGICMGAYWAGSHYFDILKDVDAVQYLKRPGTDTRRPHAKNISVTWENEPMNMFWYDGCAITGKGKFDVVATYPNGDVMAGYQDRIGLIGSHPEAEKFWYDEYTWLSKVYDESVTRNNHELLHDFVNQLMLR